MFILPTHTTFDCEQYEVINMQHAALTRGVQCAVFSVHCSVCSMKFTDACAGAGAGAVCSVQCAVYHR